MMHFSRGGGEFRFGNLYMGVVAVCLLSHFV